MKKLIDKLKGAQAPGADEQQGGQPGEEDAGEDSHFFTTIFQERADDTQSVASWQARARQVGAQPFDRADGADRFSALWGVDRYVATLGKQELDRMSEYLDFVQVDAGKEVIGQDEQGDYMLIVLEGSLAVDRVQPWGARVRLAEARPGDMLGEMSLLDAGARFSACTTLTPCVLAVVDAQGLDALIMQEPRLGLALLASLARRLSLRLRQVSARLSAVLSRS
ncbi:cyclic nucleotide-binding domain-containing protein [Aquabacterium sp. A7-Y]|uniref:cyclic nucleotide-binding domain-containing protein n=1 Tax=Aquabacterium sp. A7-Y TaxID=1349605 RepID=UPI00223D713C|nr:cyclic nucleotide-binding domain-containing protein [Aquabacterium sp. A7-Y]MCW7540009.1 cyclic nucleotide-binding domain-containing protein [Aquabacterium sp. A7-Y]